jgi:hypothetical protein
MTQTTYCGCFNTLKQVFTDEERIMPYPKEMFVVFFSAFYPVFCLLKQVSFHHKFSSTEIPQGQAPYIGQITSMINV